MSKNNKSISLNYFIFNATAKNVAIFFWGFFGFITIFYLRDFFFFSDGNILILLKGIGISILVFLPPVLFSFALIYYIYFRNYSLNIYKLITSKINITNEEKNNLLLNFEKFIVFNFIIFSVVLLFFIINYFLSYKISPSFIEANFIVWGLVCFATTCYLSLIKTEYYIMKLYHELKIYDLDSKLLRNKKRYSSAFNLLIITLGIYTIFINNLVINDFKSTYQNNIVRAISKNINTKTIENTYIENFSYTSKKNIFMLSMEKENIKTQFFVDIEKENIKSLVLFLLVLLNTSFLFVFARFHFSFFSKYQQLAAIENINKTITDGFSYDRKIPIFTFGLLANLTTLVNKLFDKVLANSKEMLENLSSINSVGSKSIDFISILKNNINKSLKNTSEINSYVKQQNKKMKELSILISQNDLSIDLIKAKLKERTESLSHIVKTVRGLDGKVDYIKSTMLKKEDLVQTFYFVINNGISNINASSEMYNTIKTSILNIVSINQTLNGLSNQINLLSMNASIEASHIGKLGEGFSAVASEIKQLGEICNEQSSKLLSELDNVKSNIDKSEKSLNSSLDYFNNLSSNYLKENTFFTDITEISDFFLEHTIATTNILDNVFKNNNNLTNETATYINNKVNISNINEGIAEINRSLSSVVATLLTISEDNYINLNNLQETVIKNQDKTRSLNNNILEFMENK